MAHLLDDFKDEKLSSFFTTGKRKLYIKQKWNPDSSDKYLELALTDCSNSWNGIYSKAEIEANSNLSNFDMSDIQPLFEQAFAEKSRTQFSIELTDSNDFVNKNLRVKKILEDEIKVEVISLNLEVVEDPSKSTAKILDYSIEYIQKLEDKLFRMNQENERISAERAMALKDLTECTELKNNIENELYSKFTCILNEKKKRIRELME